MQKLFSTNFLVFSFTALDLDIWVFHSVKFVSIYIVSCSAYLHNGKIIMQQVRVKQSPYRPEQTLRVPGGWGSRISRQSAHEGDKDEPYAPAGFITQEIFLVLISVRVWVDPRAIARPEGFCQWNIPMKPSGIEPEIFRLVEQCLNQLHNREEASVHGPGLFLILLLRLYIHQRNFSILYLNQSQFYTLKSVHFYKK